MKKTLIIITTLMIGNILVAQIPSSFDLRDYNGENYVTTVKSQEGGTCWTHGTMSAMEGNLLMTDVWNNAGESGEPALAEYHLDWWNGFNQHNNDDLDPPTGSGLDVHMGGDYMVTTAYISRLEGVVRDIDGQSYNTPPLRVSEDYHYYYPRHVEWYTAGVELETIDTIKVKIMEHGVMATCMAFNDNFIDNEYNHYQPVSSEMLPNHSIAIVGWDDDRVISGTPENGAWLCKNSWGAEWGYAGYFWISYYDKWACQEPEMGAVSFIDVEPLKYTKAYYHDYHGWRDSYRESKKAMNVFQSTEDSWLKAVNFFTDSDSVNYTIEIYNEYKTILTGLSSTTSGFVLHKGMHTVDLELPFRLETDDFFYVVLTISQGGLVYDRTSEVPVLLGGTSKSIVESTANEGESYYFNSCCGWVDFYEYDDPSGYLNTGNFCIKGLSEETTPEAFGTIIRATNSSADWGLYNAEVNFNGELGYTDNQGFVQFSDVTPENGMNVTVSANGYVDYNGTIDIIDNVVFVVFALESVVNINSFNDLGITIYPNPSNGKFTISNLSGEETIVISDITGKTVFTLEKTNQNQLIDISNNSSGVYIIRVLKNEKIYTQQIILK